MKGHVILWQTPGTSVWICQTELFYLLSWDPPLPYFGLEFLGFSLHLEFSFSIVCPVQTWLWGGSHSTRELPWEPPATRLATTFILTYFAHAPMYPWSRHSVKGQQLNFSSTTPISLLVSIPILLSALSKFLVDLIFSFRFSQVSREHVYVFSSLHLNNDWGCTLMIIWSKLVELTG